MSHPNETLIRQLFDLYMQDDREGAAGLFAEDAVLAYPGPGPLHGDHRGRTAIMRFWSEQERLAGGELRPELVDLVAGDRRVFLLVRIVPKVGTMPWMRVVSYEVADGMITGARVFEDDPAAAVAFFTKGGEGPR